MAAASMYITFAPEFADDSEWMQFKSILYSWLGTPYRHLTMVKGRGTDCTLFIGASLLEIGILNDVVYEYYPKDWYQNADTEYVLNGFHRHFEEHASDRNTFAQLQPNNAIMRGDILTFCTKGSRVSNHAAVYIGDTDRGKQIIHAAPRRGVSLFPLRGYFERHLTHIFRIMRAA